MFKQILVIVLIALMVHQPQCVLLNLVKNILPIPKVTTSPTTKLPTITIGKLSFNIPTVHSPKTGCSVQVSKFNSAGKFNGFTDSFKSQLSEMISDLIIVNTPEAARLKTRLTNSLLAINRLLNLINQYPKKEDDYKPLLQIEVKKFLNDLDDIQELMSCYQNVTVVGNGNAVYGSTGYINGNGSLMVGNQNTILGNNNAVVGNQTIVAGNNNGVLGNGNFNVGSNNTVKANNTISFTNGDSINQSNTLTVGNNTIDLTKLNTKDKTTNYLIRD